MTATLKQDTSKLRTVKSYSKERDCSMTYIYKLIEKKKLNSIKIDGVIFIVID